MYVRGCTRGAAVFNLAILSRLISARRMGGRLRKSKHGGDSAVEYVSSGNKLIKREKGGGEALVSHRVFYDTVDKWIIRGIEF